MDRRLDPKAVEPLIEVLAEDSSAAVRVAACQTLVELPVGAEVWEAAAPAVHSMLDDIPLGASEGGAALAAARLVPEQSVRERVPPAAPVEVDPMARLEARVALGDLAAVPELLGLLGTDGRDWAASLLARLPIEEAGVEPSALEPIFDTDVFGALAAARLGRTRPLAAVLKRICSDQPPEMFWGSPWTAYDWLAAVRPVPESLRSWLLARLDDELCHAAKILTWAVTGVADAQGHPLAVEPEDASRAEPRPTDPRGAERIGQALIERPFDANGQLTVDWHDLSALNASPPALAAEVATRVVVEASERSDARDLTSPSVYYWGNKVVSVLGQLPTEGLPLGSIYTLARRSDTPVMTDEQLAWLFSVSGPQRTVAELAPLVEEIEDAPTRIDLLRMIAASAESPRTPGASMLGAGPGGWGASQSIPRPAPAPMSAPEVAEESPPPAAEPAALPPVRSEPAPSESAPRGGIGTGLWGRIRDAFGGGRRSPRDRGAQAEETATWVGVERTQTRTAWPHLVCDDEVIVDTPFALEVGLGPEQVTGVSGTGPLALPAKSFELDIEINVDGFEIRDGRHRFKLLAGDDDPYPTARLFLVPLADPDLEPIRTIGATFFVDGSMRGYAYRLVRMVATAEALGHEPPPQAAEPGPGFDTAPGVLEQDPDLTIQISLGDDRAGSRLVWTARTPLFEVALPEAAPTSDIGEEAVTFARRIVDYASTAGDPQALFDYLIGTGREITEKIPAEILQALREVAVRAGDRPPTVLIVSADPYVPWELAVVDDPPLTTNGDRSPFLGGQVAIGRWPLSSRRPPPQPPGSVTVTERAVVSGKYDRVPNWPRLEAAEAEAEEFASAWPGSKRIDATYAEVRDALRGSPPADLLHFALHGQLSDRAQNGLVLIHRDPANPDQPVPLFLQPEQVRAGDLERTPFVFLNACQVGSGAKVLGDYAGMASAFLAIGASSVVAPLWSIKDDVAHGAAREFYASVLTAAAQRPATVAEALRAARARFTEASVSSGGGLGASTYLAYQYFGHPKFVLHSSTGGSPDARGA